MTRKNDRAIRKAFEHHWSRLPSHGQRTTDEYSIAWQFFKIGLRLTPLDVWVDHGGTDITDEQLLAIASPGATP